MSVTGPDKKDQKEILGYLAKYKLMSVGTYYKLPWAASVYYLFDENFNFYFVSDPKTRHCQNILRNSKVSITVADSSQKSSDKKMGFQAAGVCKRVTEVKELKDIVKAWNKRGFVPVTYKLITKVWKSRFYKIKLTEIQMFDKSQPEDLKRRNWKL